jgi:outer membrane protein assembly factor BamD
LWPTAPSLLLAIVPILLLAACSGDKDAAPKPELAADVLYQSGLDQLRDEDYKAAAESFAEVERLHPYDKMAGPAQVMSAYASYQKNDYPTAIASLTNYISLYPAAPDVAYAYYLRALCYYEQILDGRRDQTPTEQAITALQEVVQRFPNTPYARDAVIKIDLAYDRLASQQMAIGRYYQRQRQFIAAMNRFKNVVTSYQTTQYTPEALYRLVAIYVALDLQVEARKTAQVLAYNFPNSSWYRDAYALLKPSEAAKLVVEQGAADKPAGFGTKLKNWVFDWF